MLITIDTSEMKELKWGGTGIERIVQNVVNLLRIFRYDVPYMLTGGIDRDVLSKPIREASVLIANQAIDYISIYEPRAEIKELSLMNVEEDGTMRFKVVIEA